MFLWLLNWVYMFAYVGSVFPKALNAEEEKLLVEEMEKGSAEAKNILVERNLRLVAHIVKKYNMAEDTDELISVGSIGLIKAVSTYRTDKGCKLGTYAARCIENAMVTLGRWRLIICNSNKGLNIINDRLYLTCH